MTSRTVRIVFFALSAVAGLAFSFVTAEPAAHASPPALPKCFGVVTRYNGQGPWVLVCQNPCIGGGQGCTKFTGTPPGYSHTSQTCKCQGGAWDCCDIWFDDVNGAVPAGYCGENDCPGSGHCDADEDSNGDTSASCHSA